MPGRKRKLKGPPVSPEACRRPCLNCGKMMLSTCYAHRYCPKCERAIDEEAVTVHLVNDDR